MAASISLVSFWAICAFPWILSGAAAAFPVALPAGWLEQPPSPARVSTRKYKVPALRCIRRALAFNLFFVPYEVITGQAGGHLRGDAVALLNQAVLTVQSGPSGPRIVIDRARQAVATWETL